jgi:hypothetical protein
MGARLAFLMAINESQTSIETPSGGAVITAFVFIGLFLHEKTLRTGLNKCA